VNTTLAATPLRRATSVTFRPRRQRLLDDTRLVIPRPAPPPLQAAQNLDPHRHMTLKLDLRSHASRNTTRQTGRRSSDAYLSQRAIATLFFAENLGGLSQRDDSSLYDVRRGCCQPRHILRNKRFIKNQRAREDLVRRNDVCCLPCWHWKIIIMLPRFDRTPVAI
jgi:hypothetical protein